MQFFDTHRRTSLRRHSFAFHHFTWGREWGEGWGPGWRGIAHFYDEEEITKLLNKIGYSDIGTEVLHYTDRGNVVELILAEAERPREE